MAKKTHPYEKLQVGLAELIAQTAPGERLPTEPLLAQKLGVSRATLREAMRSFEGQGLIRRRQGIGTFVVGRTQVLETGLEMLESIETLADRIQLEVSMGDLKIHRIPADESISRNMKITEGTEVVRVARTILADKRPVAYLIDTLLTDVFSKEDIDSEFTGSVLDLLIKKGSPELAYSNTEIRAVDAASEIARELEIQRGDGLLLFIASLYDTTSRVIDYSYSFFLPGYFRFHVVRSVGGLQTNLAGLDNHRR